MAFVHDTHRGFGGTSIRTRLAGLSTDIAERIAKYRLYRATMTELSALSDRELADLGLSHADIGAIARQAAYGA